ncbi:unnamed protein product [Lasius platythorax]|uniref:Uncharacterized protein n=1 Tax=Lasius platythorax TaxID=488582 RepID=A0AAV2NHM0_9HYME
MNYTSVDRSRMVSHIIPVSGELQQGNGNLGTTGLSGMQDSPHSLKIKQEPFQLSSSPLPPLHQGMCPLHHHFCRPANLNTSKHYD